MGIEFNKNYNKYNLYIAQNTKNEVKNAEEANEIAKANVEFKGLEDETDLLTKNTQYLYGLNIGAKTPATQELVEKTNEILASLGYSNYKVSATQVESVANGVQSIVLPGMKLAEDGAVIAHIQNPDGPFSELFS